MTAPASLAHPIAPDAETLTAIASYLLRERNRAETVRFLSEHSTLPLLLQAAYPVLEGYFGEGVTVLIERDYSPEEGCFGPLLAGIETAKPLTESLDMLDRFYAEWWMQQPSEDRWHIVFYIG